MHMDEILRLAFWLGIVALLCWATYMADNGLPTWLVRRVRRRRSHPVEVLTALIRLYWNLVVLRLGLKMSWRRRTAGYAWPESEVINARSPRLVAVFDRLQEVWAGKS